MASRAETNKTLTLFSSSAAKDALRKIWREIETGAEWIVDADLKDYFGSVDHEKAAVIKKWFEDRLQPIAQRLLTYPVNHCGYTERPPFTRFASLRDVHPSDRLGPVAVGAQFLMHSPQVVIYTKLRQRTSRAKRA